MMMAARDHGRLPVHIKENTRRSNGPIDRADVLCESTAHTDYYHISE